MKVAVRVYSPDGYGMVPRVPISLAPGPQILSRADIDMWSLRVREMDDPEPHSASMK